jgi:hypothetical protein
MPLRAPPGRIAACRRNTSRFGVQRAAFENAAGRTRSSEKLLDIDSSFAARKELAVEPGCPADLMSDSARMNMWLHKTVLQKIAANGGNIPKELLD